MIYILKLFKSTQEKWVVLYFSSRWCWVMTQIDFCLKWIFIIHRNVINIIIIMMMMMKIRQDECSSKEWLQNRPLGSVRTVPSQYVKEMLLSRSIICQKYLFRNRTEIHWKKQIYHSIPVNLVTSSLNWQCIFFFFNVSLQ